MSWSSQTFFSPLPSSDETRKSCTVCKLCSFANQSERKWVGGGKRVTERKRSCWPWESGTALHFVKSPNWNHCHPPATEVTQINTLRADTTAWPRGCLIMLYFSFCDHSRQFFWCKDVISHLLWNTHVHARHTEKVDKDVHNQVLFYRYTNVSKCHLDMYI